MMQRDFILKELEKLNLLLAKLMGLKSAGKTSEANELINNHFEQTSGVSLNDIEALNDTSIITYLKEKKELSVIEFKVLAELCFQAAELAIPPCSDRSISHYKKALVMLEYITASEKTYDFEREERISLISTRINDCMN